MVRVCRGALRTAGHDTTKDALRRSRAGTVENAPLRSIWMNRSSAGRLSLFGAAFLVLCSPPALGAAWISERDIGMPEPAAGLALPASESRKPAAGVAWPASELRKPKAGTPAPVSEPPEPAIQVRVDFHSISEWFELLAAVDLDLMGGRPGEFVVIVTDADELERIRSFGFDATVEVENMQDHYAKRIRGDDFGAFHTYSETEAFLDELHAAYPLITTPKMSIGTSHEGRDLWAIKISDNPMIDEDEPEVLFDGLHHAREPMSVEVLLHYMAWLCENYDSDEEAGFLVNWREIWFVPVVNPDGYIYNEQTYPGGGGMWRKNRRYNGQGSWGVDPNRNYPYEWGGEGSSDDPSSNVYRGPHPASEPEVQALMSLMKAHEFVTHISFHCVAGMILIPWSHTLEHTPDDAMLRSMAVEMARHNFYGTGQAGELLYVCSGTTGDYAYGEQGEKNKIFSMCVEVGGSGFWPYEHEIAGLNEDCLWPQIYLTRIAGSCLAFQGYRLSGGNGDDAPDPGETLELVVGIRNDGVLAGARDVHVMLRTDDAYVQLHDASSGLAEIGSVSVVDNSSDPFLFTVDAAIPDGHPLMLTVVVSAEGFYLEEEIDWIVGTPVSLLYDDMESGTGNWIEHGTRWGPTSSSSHSPSHSYTDSPSGNYSSNVNTWIELAAPLDFSQSATGRLVFWHRYETADSRDACFVEASSDGGGSWHQVGPSYSGASDGWERVSLSLADHVGTAGLGLRFRLSADGSDNGDGWYLDDILVTGPATWDTPPTQPVPLSPAEGDTVYTARPTFVVGNSHDPDTGDDLTYGFLVYSDELFTGVRMSAAGIREGADTTCWTPDVSLEDGAYWWRAYADDGADRGPLTSGVPFTVKDAGEDVGRGGYVLHRARPNPFRDRVLLTFELPIRQAARLTVYDIRGRLVRTLVGGEEGPGRVDVEWCGLDDGGRRVGSGLYLLRLAAGGQVRHGKILVLR